MPTLPDDTYATILRYAGQGDARADERRFGEAVTVYNQAWQLLPAPRRQWDAATWLLSAIADASFLGGFVDNARDALDYQ